MSNTRSRQYDHINRVSADYDHGPDCDRCNPDPGGLNMSSFHLINKPQLSIIISKSRKWRQN